MFKYVTHLHSLVWFERCGSALYMAVNKVNISPTVTVGFPMPFMVYRGCVVLEVDAPPVSF